LYSIHEPQNLIETLGIITFINAIKIINEYKTLQYISWKETKLYPN